MTLRRTSARMSTAGYGNVLADVFKEVGKTGTQAGASTTPTLLASGVPCTAWPGLGVRDWRADLGRQTNTVPWRLRFAAPPVAGVRLDVTHRVELVDTQGVRHVLKVTGSSDPSQQGREYLVEAQEYVL